MSTQSEINSKIKDVIERNFDAFKGYEKAADKISDSHLASSFRDQAEQRKRFALELEAETNVLESGEVEKMEKGTFEGNVHRAWLDLKTAFSSDNDEAVLEESIRGEESALEEYDELLNETALTEHARNLISQQRATIQNCISQLKQLESVLD